MGEIPVYLITGFLDSGKTSFLNGIIEQGFARGSRTVIMCCEEGEVPYVSDIGTSVKLVKVENEDDLTFDLMKDISKKYRPEQVIIEYNGMWMLDTLLDNLPPYWLLYQVMTFVEASTFEPYSRNFGQLMMEKIKFADMLVFNRCTDELKENLRARNLRMVNRRADIFLEDPSGQAENYLTGNENFFDMDQPVIDIPDDDYGIWYVDIMDHPEKYRGKTLHMKLVMCRSKQYPGIFCPGRFAMVCCEADITFLGMMARGDLEQFEEREWIEVTANADVVKHPAYDTGDGPVLDILTAARCDRPAEDVVSF